jgi:tetratricopeptide (TPR) repeat protein
MHVLLCLFLTAVSFFSHVQTAGARDIDSLVMDVKSRNAEALYQLGFANYPVMGFAHYPVNERYTASQAERMIGISWFSVAAALGHTQAQYMLALHHYNEAPHPIQLSDASTSVLISQWRDIGAPNLVKAAKKGHHEAQCLLGVYLFYDLKNIKAALEWLQKATEHKNEAKDRRKSIITRKALCGIGQCHEASGEVRAAFDSYKRAENYERGAAESYCDLYEVYVCLGVIYQHPGPTQDWELAFSYLCRSDWDASEWRGGKHVAENITARPLYFLEDIMEHAREHTFYSRFDDPQKETITQKALGRFQEIRTYFTTLHILYSDIVSILLGYMGITHVQHLCLSSWEKKVSQSRTHPDISSPLKIWEVVCPPEFGLRFAKASS